MAKPRRNDKKSQPTSGGAVRTTAELKAAQLPIKNRSTRGGRETIDALVVAFVLAFLIRTFLAEQFVIPTGSMAPTLMGRHKDVECVQCGQRFKVNASDESSETAYKIYNNPRNTPLQAALKIRDIQGVAGTCPQCGYIMPFRSDGLEKQLAKGTPPPEEQTNYGGDRIVVRKYAYSLADPDRWDVVVFKYPGDTKSNYIKRLVGLPEEDLRIYQGDLFTRPAGETQEHTIEPKPADKVLALRQLVHDTDHDPMTLYSAGWPLRWQTGDSDWKVKTKPNGKNVEQTYSTKSDGTPQWLRYVHTVPSSGVWDALIANEGEEDLSRVQPRPALITDQVAYNTGLRRDRVLGMQEFTNRPYKLGDFSNIGAHWVSDLSVDAEVRVDSESGQLLLELVEAGTHYGVSIDIASGEALFTRRAFDSSESEQLATAPTPLRGPGNYSLRFANVDDQLLLWINNKLIACDGKYEPAATQTERAQLLPQTNEQDLGDLAPVAIGIAGGSLHVDHLQVWRDIYYLAARWDTHNDCRASDNFVTDYIVKNPGISSEGILPAELINLPTDPELWSHFANRKVANFTLDDDHFFVMGDNSAASLDARLWTGGSNPGSGQPGGPYLERHLLVGEALSVYWPHAWYSMPFTNKILPLWPNFEDMRIVR